MSDKDYTKPIRAWKTSHWENVIKQENNFKMQIIPSWLTYNRIEILAGNLIQTYMLVIKHKWKNQPSITKNFKT